MHIFACFDLMVISSVVVLVEPGTLQEEDEVPIRLALQELPIAFSAAHSIPSTDGISNL